MLTGWLTGAAILVGQAPEPEGWKPFAPERAAFSVRLPGVPREERQKVNTATGQLDVTLWVADANPDLTFLVTLCDYPAEEVKKGTENRRLDFARDGAVAGVRGTLRSEKKIMVQDHPGRDLVIVGKGETMLRVRLVVVERRLYQLTVIGPAGPTPAREAAAFLDSFRLRP